MKLVLMKPLTGITVAAVVLALSGCIEPAHDQGPPTVLNPKLTEDAMKVSELPADVEQVRCSAKSRLILSDQVVCSVMLRGRAVKDIGAKEIGWSIDVRVPSDYASSASYSLDDPAPRYLLPSQFDISPLASTGFLFAAKNTPHGTAIEVAADQSAITFNQARDFVVAVLPVVSGELEARIEAARAHAPDSIRDTWSSTQTTQ